MCEQYLEVQNYVESMTLAYSMIISLFIIGAEYIHFNNVRQNKNLYKFANLLLLICWGILFGRVKYNNFYYLATFCSILIPYKLAKIMLLFVFQGEKFRYKKLINNILKGCIIVTICSIIKPNLFYKVLLISWVIDFACVGIVLIFNIKRVLYIVKKEFLNIVGAMLLTIILYSVYITINGNMNHNITDVLIYALLILPIYIVYIIVCSANGNKVHIGLENGIIGIVGFILTSVIIKLLHLNVIFYFIVGHSIVLLLMIHYLIEYKNIVSIIIKKRDDSLVELKKNNYRYNIIQTMNEIELKRSFSNYLHDDILQDLLAIKNMLSKIDKPSVKQLIIEMLDNLNRSIRAEMQEYHAVILSDISFKENIENLLRMLAEKYKDNMLSISLDCKDDFFLVQPYDTIIYRIIKELVTNIYKHSEATNAKLVLSHKKDMINIIIKDNGIGMKDIDELHKTEHKGMRSIQEKIMMLDGEMIINSKEGAGVEIEIKMPMKGEESYQYFIS